MLAWAGRLTFPKFVSADIWMSQGRARRGGGAGGSPPSNFEMEKKWETGTKKEGKTGTKKEGKTGKRKQRYKGQEGSDGSGSRISNEKEAGKSKGQEEHDISVNRGATRCPADRGMQV